jgi:hypothetical protein
MFWSWLPLYLSAEFVCQNKHAQARRHAMSPHGRRRYFNVVQLTVLLIAGGFWDWPQPATAQTAFNASLPINTGTSCNAIQFYDVSAMTCSPCPPVRVHCHVGSQAQAGCCHVARLAPPPTSLRSRVPFHPLISAPAHSVMPALAQRLII